MTTKVTFTIGSYDSICNTLNGLGHRLDFDFQPEFHGDIEHYRVLDESQQPIGTLVLDMKKNEVTTNLSKEITQLLLK